MSSRMRAGSSRIAASIPASPSSASTSAYPSAPNTARTSIRFSGLSSMWRILSGFFPEGARSVIGDAPRPRRHERQREVECRAVLLAAFDPDEAFMQLHELLTDGESKPRAAGFPGERALEASERLEQSRQVFRADPDPRIGDADVGDLSLLLDADDDATRVGEFDGIGEQIQKNLLHLRTVGAERREFDGHFLLELDRLCPDERHGRLDALLHQLVKIERLRAQVGLPH